MEIPEKEISEHNERVKQIKLNAFQMALMVERMDEAARRTTGFKDGGHVIIAAAKDIEKLTRALEAKYP